MKNISYKYKEELSAHLIVAGWDRRDGGQVGKHVFSYNVKRRSQHFKKRAGKIYINNVKNNVSVISTEIINW